MAKGMWGASSRGFQQAIASAGTGLANVSNKIKAEVDLLRLLAEDPAQKERRGNAPRDRFVCLKRLKESVKELLQHQYENDDGESALQTVPLNEDDPPAAHICT
jgi:hypothetical protein